MIQLGPKIPQLFHVDGFDSKMDPSLISSDNSAQSSTFQRDDLSLHGSDLASQNPKNANQSWLSRRSMTDYFGSSSNFNMVSDEVDESLMAGAHELIAFSKGEGLGAEAAFMPGMRLRLTIQTALQLTQQLQHRSIDDEFRRVYQNANMKTVNFAGLEFSYASVSRKDLPYLVAIGSMGMSFEDMNFVVHDFFQMEQVPNVLRPHLEMIVAVHEYGELVFGDHHQASLLEFAVVQQLGILPEYLDFLYRDNKIKFRDVALNRMGASFRQSLESYGIDGNALITSLSASPNNDTDASSKKRAEALKDSFRWPKGYESRYQNLWLENHHDVADRMQNWAKIVMTAEQVRGYMNKAAASAFSAAQAFLERDGEIGEAIKNAELAFYGDLKDLNDELQGVLDINELKDAPEILQDVIVSTHEYFRTSLVNVIKSSVHDVEESAILERINHSSLILEDFQLYMLEMDKHARDHELVKNLSELKDEKLCEKIKTAFRAECQKISSANEFSQTHIKYRHMVDRLVYLQERLQRIEIQSIRDSASWQYICNVRLRIMIQISEIAQHNSHEFNMFSHAGIQKIIDERLKEAASEYHKLYGKRISTKAFDVDVQNFIVLYQNDWRGSQAQIREDNFTWYQQFLNKSYKKANADDRAEIRKLWRTSSLDGFNNQHRQEFRRDIRDIVTCENEGIISRQFAFDLICEVGNLLHQDVITTHFCLSFLKRKLNLSLEETLALYELDFLRYVRIQLENVTDQRWVMPAVREAANRAKNLAAQDLMLIDGDIKPLTPSDDGFSSDYRVGAAIESCQRKLSTNSRNLSPKQLFEELQSLKRKTAEGNEFHQKVMSRINKLVGYFQSGLNEISDPEKAQDWVAYYVNETVLRIYENKDIMDTFDHESIAAFVGLYFVAQANLAQSKLETKSEWLSFLSNVKIPITELLAIADKSQLSLESVLSCYVQCLFHLSMNYLKPPTIAFDEDMITVIDSMVLSNENLLQRIGRQMQAMVDQQANVSRYPIDSYRENLLQSGLRQIDQRYARDENSVQHFKARLEYIFLDLKTVDSSDLRQQLMGFGRRKAEMRSFGQGEVYAGEIFITLKRLHDIILRCSKSHLTMNAVANSINQKGVLDGFTSILMSADCKDAMLIQYLAIIRLRLAISTGEKFASWQKADEYLIRTLPGYVGPIKDQREHDPTYSHKFFKSIVAHINRNSDKED